LVAELATGGMATVYLARVSGAGGFQRFVAIKRLHPHLAREEEFVQMFLDEARLAARIHHPNVVSILEIGASEQAHYIVMEYVEGSTIAHMLATASKRGQRLPIQVGIRVVIDVLTGLHAAHELKDDDGKSLEIVHRDVSPQNILVGVDGSGRLSDFGVARAATRLSTTRSGQVKGKVAYMAPEQARSEKDIDGRADIFAAGVVLWEVITCRRLFRGETEAHTLNKVLTEPIPSLESVLPGVPASLQRVVDGALQRDRALRFSTAAEFADQLEAAARAAGVLGSGKDVAGYLEVTLGAEISEQREAVRAWVARSESGRRKWSHPPPPVAGASMPVVTGVVERSNATPATLTLPPSPRLPRNLTPNPPEAVVARTGATPAAATRPVEASPDATAPRSAVRKPAAGQPVWPWLVLIASALALVLVVIFRTRSTDAGSAAVPPSAPAPPTALVPAPAATRSAPVPEPKVTEWSVPTASAGPAATGSRPPPHTTRGPDVPSVPAPAASSSSPRDTLVPDDLSHNPYR
jgi:eukaryotic-like serine/threonine-protein kinase